MTKNQYAPFAVLLVITVGVLLNWLADHTPDIFWIPVSLASGVVLIKVLRHLLDRLKE